uniref:Uncharacterized protein n=1 Tax=Babesia bovis TaxID=5865 RepID=A7APK2_BABBO|eukprot:XP_001612054.1 hypothetical protein [Babesia bovis T2Bo]
MDHHVDGEITGSLSYALENCLSKCKHMLQDDSLVEHYENLYQNNLFTYNKILALIKRSLEDCYTNHRCIKNAIENDTGIKIGMHHENENIVKKSLLTKEKVAQLICKKETMAHELQKNIQWDAELDRSLEQSSQEGIRAQTQLKLACFAKNRMKSSVELIEKTINDLENSCENTQTLVVTRQDEINHIIDEMNCINQTNIKEIEHIKRIHEEMDEELRQLGFQHHTTVQKLEETQDIISNIKKSKEEAQSALGKIENEIDNREQCISELKQEIASIENEKAMLKAEIENINCENERLKDVKLDISSEVNKIQEKIKSYEMDIRNNKSKIKLHKRGIKELEAILTSKHKEIITIYNTKAEQYRRYNVMRMQLEDAVWSLNVKYI